MKRYIYLVTSRLNFRLIEIIVATRIKSLNSFLFKGHNPIPFVLISNSVDKAVF